MTSLAHKRADLLDQGQTAITDYRWMQVHRTTGQQQRQWKRHGRSLRAQAKAQLLSRPDLPPSSSAPIPSVPPPSCRHAMRLSLVELRPRTGRTHQLRVHMAEQLRMPILGDYKYFPRQHPGQQMHLHCRHIMLEDWQGAGGTLSVRAPLPAHWIRTMYAVPLRLRAPPPRQA